MQVKTFNLQESKVIRDLNPADINCLISVSGMVTRTSAVIPDLTCACLRDPSQCPVPVCCCSLPGKRDPAAWTAGLLMASSTASAGVS